jgi:hypothetical protein
MSCIVTGSNYQRGGSVGDNNGLVAPGNDEISGSMDDSDFEEEEVVVIGVERYHEPEDEPPAEESHEDKVAKVEEAVFRSPLHRELLYKVLDYCREMRILQDVEEQIASFPEFAQASQSQYILITYLVKAGGLDVFELDESGQIIPDEKKDGLGEDEIDDLVVDFAYQTTDAGLTVAEKMSPKARLLELLDINPAYYDTYLELLDFLQEKRSTAQVDTLLRGRPVLMAGRGPNDRPMQPSVFIDRLERAGGIFWQDGWMVTDEGRGLLDSIKALAKDV